MANAFQHSAFQVNAFQEGLIDGVLYAVDQNDTGSFTGTVTQEVITFGDVDGWKKRKEIDKKIEELQAAKRKAMRDAAAKRKQGIRDLVSPVAKVKQSKVQSKQEVKADIPLAKTEELQRSISYLERQRDNILEAVAYINKQRLIQEQLLYIEAQRQEELDDEAALLLLLN
jgi:hypothetical protein